MLSNEDALKLINTLRNGATPIYHSESVMSGRDLEITEFKRCLHLLSNGSGLVKLITGEYGVGKSFLVNSFKQIGLSEDYVIASFQINNGFRLNKLEDLYYAVMHNLFLKHKPNEKVSFDDIFTLWVENLQNAPHPERKRYEVNTVCQELSKFNMNFTRAFLIFMRGRIQRNQEMMNVSSAWLTGERNIPYELKQKYELVGSVDKANTIDFLKAFVKLVTLLDYKGVIVFIDEIDLVVHDRSDIRFNAYNNLKHLIDLSSSGEMSNILFVFSGTDVILNDKEKGIQSNIPLAQRLNFSPNADDALLKSSINKDLSQPIIRLESLDTNDRQELTRKIINLYGQNEVLSPTLNHKEIEALVMLRCTDEPFVTRHFVSKLIEYLDNEKG